MKRLAIFILFSLPGIVRADMRWVSPYVLPDFPDVLVSSNAAVNYKNSRPLTLGSLEVNGNLYIWNLY